jgi:L-alanine-DL-glutamate epimerase-like enolase superfamily enzyme
VSSGLLLESLAIEPLVIPFTTGFAHAAATRGETSSVVVTATAHGGVTGVGEGCPRPYVTGESIDSALAFFAEHRPSLLEVGTVDGLRGWMGAHRAAIDANPAAWCAIELALLDAFGHAAAMPLEALVGVAPLDGAFRYSAVLGDMSPEAFGATAAQYHAVGMHDLKVKLSGDLARDRAKLATLAAIAAPLRIRVDANALWPEADAAVAFLRALETPLTAVEEPLAPAGRLGGLAAVADALELPVILDESLARADAIAALRPPATRWIVNVRVSKMGGVLRSLAVVEAARAAGVRVIVGAQVGETSRLTRAALAVAQAARDVLVAQEGAFGTRLLTRDVCDPPLMFGAGGRLTVADHPRLLAPGLGMAP